MDRGRQVAQALQGIAEIVGGVGIVRCQPYRRSQMRQRVGRPVGLVEQLTEQIVRLGQPGCQRQRAPIARLGLFRPLGGVECGGQILVRQCKLGRLRQHALQQRDRVVVAARLDAQHAAQMQRVDMRGLLREHAFADLFGLGEASGLLVRQRDREQIGQRGLIGLLHGGGAQAIGSGRGSARQSSRSSAAKARAWPSPSHTGESASRLRSSARSRASSGTSFASATAVLTNSLGSRTARWSSPTACSSDAVMRWMKPSPARLITGTPMHSASKVVVAPLNGKLSSAMSISR